MNKLFDVDSYKVSHWKQFPEGTISTFAYIESRGGMFDETLFFGLRYILKEILETPITMEMVDEAKEVFKQHFGNDNIFNYDGFKYIVEKYNGYFPLKIRSVEEGSLIKTSNVLLTIESVDEKLFWLPSWIETQILRLWYPITVATLSYNIKKIVYRFNQLTSENESDIDFKLHDFGSRGVSSDKSAEIGSSAHLINFYGTDTVNSIPFIKKYYGDSEILCYSIPASEHSTITSWTKDHEKEAYKNMVHHFGTGDGEKMFAVVSDSYNIYNAVANIWPSIIFEELSKGSSGMKLVIRPDSGDPVKVILKLLILLDIKLGSTYNKKGYKIINHNVKLIQGDGININTVEEILKTISNEFIDEKIFQELKEYIDIPKDFKGKYSSDNVNFGMGSCLLQRINRDTQKFAMKVSSIKIKKGIEGNDSEGISQGNDSEVDVFKNPIDDPGKQSKKGRLDLINEDGILKTVRIEKEKTFIESSVMKTVYENCKIIYENLNSFKEIREKVNNHLKKEKIKRIGIYGGSFDPVTKAHLKLIQKSLEKKEGQENFYDELHVIPVVCHTDKKLSFNYYERFEMLKLCLKKNINDSRLKINPIEISIFNQGIYDYDTYYVIKELKKKYKDFVFYLILGNDTYDDLTNKKWSNSNSLLNEVIPITFDYEDSELKEIKNIRSSIYRKTLDPSLLTDEVNEYIRTHDFL